jgi:hypothetical protein
MDNAGTHQPNVNNANTSATNNINIATAMNVNTDNSYLISNIPCRTNDTTKQQLIQKFIDAPYTIERKSQLVQMLNWDYISKSTQDSSKTKDINYSKTTLIGNAGTGKTCLTESFARPATFENGFEDNLPHATIGAAFTESSITLPNGMFVPVQLWDTSGNDLNKIMILTYAQGKRDIVL